MAETCKACGKAWTDHLGVDPTCALLQEAVAILKKIGEIENESTTSSTYGEFVCAKCGRRSKHGHYKNCPIGASVEFLSRFASTSENEANATR